MQGGSKARNIQKSVFLQHKIWCFFSSRTFIIKTTHPIQFLLRKHNIPFLFIEILSLEQKHTFPANYSRYLLYSETQLHTPPLNPNPRTALLYFYRPFPTSACCSISWHKVHDPSIRLSEFLFSTLQDSYLLSIILKFFPSPPSISLPLSYSLWERDCSLAANFRVRQFSNVKQQIHSVYCSDC